jgi:hypothetical protein
MRILQLYLLAHSHLTGRREQISARLDALLEPVVESESVCKRTGFAETGLTGFISTI